MKHAIVSAMASVLGLALLLSAGPLRERLEE